MTKKYMQKHNKKTVDFSYPMCYYIVKERETENLREPKPYRLMNDRIGDQKDFWRGQGFTDLSFNKQAEFTKDAKNKHLWTSFKKEQ